MAKGKGSKFFIGFLIGLILGIVVGVVAINHIQKKGAAATQGDACIEACVNDDGFDEATCKQICSAGT